MARNDRLQTLPSLPNPFASSEVEMPLGLGLAPMGVSTSLDTNGKRGRAAPHPKADTKKTLSYIARLCQLSSQLMQYGDKGGR